MKYKLIAMDFDGTLLTDTKKVTKETKKTLYELKRKGYKVVGVTARGLGSAKYGIPVEIFDYLILNNGAYLYDVKKQTGTYIGTLSIKNANEITKDIEDLSEQIDFISGTTYYIYKNKKKADVDFIKEVEHIEEIKEPLARMNIYLKKQEDVEPWHEYLNKKYKDINCFVMQDSDDSRKWLVVNPKGLNKKETLEKLGKDQKIDLSEMIFFGDGLNDLEVMRTVGYSVAMGNALKEIKQLADEITDTNNKDGIAKFLKKHLTNN